MTKSKKMIIGTLPFVALIVLFAIFCGIVSSKGYRLLWPRAGPPGNRQRYLYP